MMSLYLLSWVMLPFAFGYTEGVPCFCFRWAYGGKETSSYSKAGGSTGPIWLKTLSTSMVSIWFSKLTSTPPSYQLDCFSRFQLQRRLFEEITMDWITHLPPNIHEGLMLSSSLSTGFSKLVRFVLCTTAIDAGGTAKLFFDHWVCKFGMPRKIISDWDPRFSSMFWTSLMSLLDCKVAMSSAYHP